MKHKQLFSILVLMFLATVVQAKKWTLDECLQYAMQNNISLQQAGLTRQSELETMKESKSQLFPSLSFSTSQNLAYSPWKNKNDYTVTGGKLDDSDNNVSYNGTYTVGAKWTVWNGNRNVNTVKKNQLSIQSAVQDSITSARTIEEKIMTLYIQILYSLDAVKVNKETLAAAKVNENRAKEMVKVGSMSKAECSQLTATRATDEYNVVKSEGDVMDFKRQLKALLQIIDDEEFDVAGTEATDAMALQAIPSLQSVFEAARDNRPEIKKAQLDVQSAEIQQKIAKAQRMPTVSLDASIATNSTTMNDSKWGDQIKSNFNVGGGVTVSVPIFDQRATRTAIHKANVQRQTALLEVQNQETTLHSTIEKYWIDAQNNQNQYKSAKVSTASAKESYDLLSEQFALGLKNVVELDEGKTKLLSAEQNELQSKYMTILDIKMLEFYKK